MVVEHEVRGAEQLVHADELYEAEGAVVAAVQRLHAHSQPRAGGRLLGLGRVLNLHPGGGRVGPALLQQRHLQTANIN